jgi:uncharacterized protein (DUF362 family)
MQAGSIKTLSPGLGPNSRAGRRRIPAADPGRQALEITRRQFIHAGLGAALVAVPGLAAWSARADAGTSVVSIVRIANDNVEAAVEQAIDLLGGIASVTQGRQRILLKPNLVADGADATTKPAVIRALARLLQAAGKEVSIGEGSAVASGFNSLTAATYVTRCHDVLDGLQRHVFDRLGYTALASALGIPLVNLHTGDLVAVPVPAGLFWKELVLHRALLETDLLVSVPMMKTHLCATVTLGLKNLIGLYPGAIYGSPRAWIHGHTAAVSPGVAFEILDMARVNKLGLTVIDAHWAMEGNGPTGGKLVKMNLILAGTNPLATDMVGAAVMGFTDLDSIPTFAWAHALGMAPATLSAIEVRGEPIASVKRDFLRPTLRTCYSPGPEIYPAPKPTLTLAPDGKGVVTWNDAIPQPNLEFTPDHKAFVTWTNTAAGSPEAVLERLAEPQGTNWLRCMPQTPGRFEFDATSGSHGMFRLRKPF